ncbi:outer membrane protein assembly factor BamE [Wolbachia endosymbiont of Pentidionis agamae]|uniref:outer membrane protein assembly factor BamE n=1 Tax=Wolbachia endosymbiont of Pentidionis agamae TaxID=3110435 RepID=UPI002FD58096
MRILISFIFFFLISGYTTYNHGIPEAKVELWSNIKIGDNKEKVIQILGSPTLISQFDSNVWYYISYKTRQVNFLGKRKYSSKSLQISFNLEDSIVNIEEIRVSERSVISSM